MFGGRSEDPSGDGGPDDLAIRSRRCRGRRRRGAAVWTAGSSRRPVAVAVGVDDADRRIVVCDPAADGRLAGTDSADNSHDDHAGDSLTVRGSRSARIGKRQLRSTRRARGRIVPEIDRPDSSGLSFPILQQLPDGRTPVLHGHGLAMYKLLLSSRYLRTRFIALASIVSVMLGVATMIVVNSVMTGFSVQMRERIHGILADVMIETSSARRGGRPAVLHRRRQGSGGAVHRGRHADRRGLRHDELPFHATWTSIGR